MWRPWIQNISKCPLRGFDPPANDVIHRSVVWVWVSVLPFGTEAARIQMNCQRSHRKLLRICSQLLVLFWSCGAENGNPSLVIPDKLWSHTPCCAPGSPSESEKQELRILSPPPPSSHCHNGILPPFPSKDRTLLLHLRSTLQSR